MHSGLDELLVLHSQRVESAYESIIFLADRYAIAVRGHDANEEWRGCLGLTKAPEKSVKKGNASQCDSKEKPEGSVTFKAMSSDYLV